MWIAYNAHVNMQKITSAIYIYIKQLLTNQKKKMKLYRTIALHVNKKNLFIKKLTVIIL